MGATRKKLMSWSTDRRWGIGSLPIRNKTGGDW
jgi:hypothetical protein